MAWSEMRHRIAIFWMVAAALMWSLGGVVSRHLESSEGLEITFWRSAFAALTVFAWFMLRSRGASVGGPLAVLAQGGKVVWLSGAMWAVMFTCFMVALTLTKVANVLIVQCLAPVFTALLAWFVLRKPVGVRTWIAIAVAAAGIVTMYAFDVSGLGGRHVAGVLIALFVPVASAINWVVLQRAGKSVDMGVSVLVGGTISALLCLPFALPLQLSAHDLSLLAFLGVVQLGIPCVLVMYVARHVSAPEAALLGLLEVVFGILLAWAFGAERPGMATLIGGSAVLAALVFNELSRPAAKAAESLVA
jgi:drug/metabolite transporter (DMT)-like permease